MGQRWFTDEGRSSDNGTVRAEGDSREGALPSVRFGSPRAAFTRSRRWVSCCGASANPRRVVLKAATDPMQSRAKRIRSFNEGVDVVGSASRMGSSARQFSDVTGGVI